jgi:hypothetical protein
MEMRFEFTSRYLSNVVFAWTKEGRKGDSIEDKIIAFGAHLDAEYYFGGRRYHNGNTYAFLRKLMKSAFGNTSPADIICHVIGDHSKGCPGSDCKNMGTELLASLHKANYQVNTHFYKIFPGATYQAWQTDVYRTNYSLHSYLINVSSL